MNKYQSEAHDRADMLQLAYLYAKAMDGNLPGILPEIMTKDIEIIGPGFHMTGMEQVLEIPANLGKMFLKTRHLIHNQTVTVDNGEAEGETYCTASHVLPPSGEGGDHQLLVWAIRYQERFRRDGAQWRFTRRELILDWTETRNISYSADVK